MKLSLLAAGTCLALILRNLYEYRRMSYIAKTRFIGQHTIADNLGLSLITFT